MSVDTSKSHVDQKGFADQPGLSQQPYNQQPPAYNQPGYNQPGYSQQIYPQTVVVQQPVGIPRFPINQREWHSGLCACCDDCEICCCVYWCPCVEMCSIAKALDEKWRCCLYCSSCSAYSPCLAPLRTKTRIMMGIKGDVCMDWCCASVCCPALVMCQISRQLRAAGLR